MDINILRYILDEDYRSEFSREWNEIIKKCYKMKEFVHHIFEPNLLKSNPAGLLSHARHLGIKSDIIKNDFKDQTTIEFTFKFISITKNDADGKNKSEIIIPIKCIFKKDKPFKKNNEYLYSLKLLNRKDLLDSYYELIYWIGYTIGADEELLDRFRIDKAIFEDDKNVIKIKESIYDVHKIFYDYTCKIVSQNPNQFHFLFPFKKYIFNNESLENEKTLKSEKLNSDTDFYKFISCKTLNKKDWTAVKTRYVQHKNNSSIPEL